MPNHHPPALKHWLFWIVCGILVVLSYKRFFPDTYFTQDDYVWLCFSKFYQEPLAVFWRDTLCGQFFRPVGQLWWMTIHAFFGDRVLAYQVGFLLTHLLISLLGGLLARRIFGGGIGGFVFLLYLVNPLFAMRISTNYHFNFDGIGVAFYLGSLTALTYAVEKRSWILGGASLLAAVISYFSKEAFFTLPAAVVLVLGIESPGSAWRWGTLRLRRRWVVVHTLTAVVAFAWRTLVIEGFGGYGLVSLTGLSSFFSHVWERLLTFFSFAGWSLIPHLARFDPQTLWPAYASAALMIGLTIPVWFSKPRLGPGPVWIWSWMFVTWAPSLTMTTFAPVSFYICLFGSLLLLASSLRRIGALTLVAIPIAVYFSFANNHFYSQRESGVIILRQQHEQLKRDSRDLLKTNPPGSRVVFFHCHPELLPDAVIKYSITPGQPLPDVLFLSDQHPRINWVLTNRVTGSFRPLTVSPIFQDGYMEMDPYRVYPLELPIDRTQVLRDPRFRFYDWQNERFVDITADNPLR